MGVMDVDVDTALVDTAPVDAARVDDDAGVDTAGVDDIAVGETMTPVGRVSVAVSPIGLCDVSWCARAELADRLDGRVVEDAARVAPVLAQLAEYFTGRRRTFDIALDWRFTARTQQAVLHTLTRVGYGHSITYGALAERSGTGVPARGIGAIMGSNPIPIVVPCHRVLAHDGLGGYSGGTGGDGLAVKRWLLTLEGILPPTLDWAL